MASITTKTGDQKIVSKSGAPAKMQVDRQFEITRASSDSKDITIKVTMNFKLVSGSLPAGSYSIRAWGNTNGANDSDGWTYKWIKEKDESWNGSSKEVSWTRTFQLIGKSMQFKFYITSSSPYYEYKSQTSPEIITLSVPEFVLGANSVRSFTISPNPVTVGKEVTFSGEVAIGQNNSVDGYTIMMGNEPYQSGSLSSSTSAKYSVIASKSLNGNSFKIGFHSNINDSWVYSSAKTLTVTDPVAAIPTNVTASAINGDKSSDSTIISCKCDSPAYYSIGSDGEKIAMTYNSYFDSYSATAYVSRGQVIYVYGYESGGNPKYSKGVSVTPSVYYIPKINSFSINPIILKDNTGIDLAVTIQSGSISGSSGGGGITYSWTLKYGSSSNNLFNSENLGVSSSSFNNINISERVPKGYFYKIVGTITNSDGYSLSTDEIEEYRNKYIYQIPKNPVNVTFNKIIPKHDPKDGYNIMVEDGKTFYGAGLFPIWIEEDITDAYLPIKEREIIYQSRSGTQNFSETKVAQIRYHTALIDGTTWDFNNSEYAKPVGDTIYHGGGAILEVNSLEETRIGVRITDSLGQSTDTFYSVQNFFKAESPSFGGNLLINTIDFKPFTAKPDDLFICYSSVAKSNSQDSLFYHIECYVNDRKSTIEIIPGVSISRNAFDVGNTGDVLYSDSNIKITKKDEVTIQYEIKNSYLSNLFLTNKELRVEKNGVIDQYNNDFDVVYKIYVQDSFDSMSTIYNSSPALIKFIEAPDLSHNVNIQLGINRYIKSLNPYYDDSIIEINNSTENNDRMINPGESVILKFKQARDYNGADYKTLMRGDVTQYNIYVSRNDDRVTQNYNNLTYTLLKTYSVNELHKALPNSSTDEYYYLEYPLTAYQQSKFITFKIEAVDSKSNKSAPIYSNTYLVPCRATPMDFYVNKVHFEETLTGYNISISAKINDFGASYFKNEKYGYSEPLAENSFPNYERNFTINSQTFNKLGYINIEASLDGNFDNKGTINLIKDSNLPAVSFNNYFTTTLSVSDRLGDKHYTDIEQQYVIDNFPAEWSNGIKDGYIKKIFFKATYKIAYGFKDINSSEFDNRYLYVLSTSAPYSYYEDAPTFSYRSHQVGINTKDFSPDSSEGQKEVLIIQDNGSYNLVVFKGAEQRIVLNLTDRTFYTLDTNNEKRNEINFNTGRINGMTIDCGQW